MATVALLVGSFHTEHMAIMRAAAEAEAQRLGLALWGTLEVPGSMEKPLALRWLLERPEVDGAVVLGIIERGETDHGLVMGHTVVQALVQLQLTTGKPVGVGILGPGILPSQIASRRVPYAQAAVKAVAHMLNTAHLLAVKTELDR